MEGYILGGRNISESEFKENFKRINGPSALNEFEKLFRENFIRENDLRNISLMGANTIRLPFNYRLIEKAPYSYCRQGILYLKKALTLADKYNLGVILDLHAAPGSQNQDWHSDSRGKALFWQNQNYRERACKLWQAIVQEIKDEPALIGYDIINEPVIGKKNTDIVKSFYREAIRNIRAIDKINLIFLEGDIWAQRIEYLKDLLDENIAVSIHTYQPLNFTFNFVSFYRFPGKIDSIAWNKDRVKRYLEPYYKFAVENNVRMYVGEFGINWRGGFWGELKYLQAILSVFESFNFDYTYWTYKAIAGHVFPDGLYQYLPDTDYVKREGPLYGWENYIRLWKKEKQRIADFWQTENFTPNRELIALLKRFFRK
jgi:aryl-phospho-beta-D-glucosidase BglC (GH1 family)